MLDCGREKIASAGLDGRLSLVEGDAQNMPFDADSFDASCIAFGIRNVPDRALGLREMCRVTRRGGRVAVLELGEPERGPIAAMARLHVHHVVPRIGAWLSGADEYRYLERSIAAFPKPDAFQGLMRDAGLSLVSHERFVFGAANLFVGEVE